MSKVHERLERVGRVLGLGFGDRVAIGVFLSFLEEVTLDEAYDYVKNNRSRIDELSDEEWAGFRGYAENLNKFPDAEAILKVLRKRKPELWSVLYNFPNGKEWLEQELQKAKEKLL